MSRKKLFFCFLILILVFGGSFAQNRTVPPSPYVDAGACPFECCTYREWTVLKPTSVKRKMSENSAELFRVRKGDRVSGVTGVVITTKAGVVKALKNSKLGDVSVKRGETIYLLTYLGEGVHKIWRKGRVFEGDIFVDASSFKIVSKPRSVWWVKIKNRRGQIGWSREPDNFGNKDKCGAGGN